MADTEFAPPDCPTPAEQLDAMKKGLGRALRWAAAGKLDHAPLLDACLHDQRYDHQVESVRSTWLWECILACHAADRLRGPIFEAFTRLPEESASQLCGLARHFAVANCDFRARLYEVVRAKPFPTMNWIGEDDVIALDGETGFEFVVDLRGERLDREPWEWTHTSLMNDAIQRWGRERAVRLLAMSNVPGTRRFLEAWPGEPTGPPAETKSTHRERMRAIAVADILAAASNKDRCIWFRGWGMNADETDLRTVLDAVRRESDPHRLARLLRVFTARPLSEFDERILDLAGHADSAVRDVAIRSLEPNTHPAIRSLGLELLTDPDQVADAIALFINNYAAGDETRIRTAISSVAEDDLHSALMNSEKVLDANDRADPLPLGLFVFRHTPCGHCRESMAELLYRRGAMPDWVRDELRFDACEDGRKLAATIDGSGNSSP